MWFNGNRLVPLGIIVFRRADLNTLLAKVGDAVLPHEFGAWPPCLMLPAIRKIFRSIDASLKLPFAKRLAGPAALTDPRERKLINTKNRTSANKLREKRGFFISLSPWRAMRVITHPNP